MPATISHAKSDTIADFTGTITVNNSSGGTLTILATNIVRPSDWNSNHQNTLSVAGSELFSLKFWEPIVPLSSTLSSVPAGTWWLDPFVVPAVLGSGQLNILIGDAAGFLNGTTFSAVSTGSVTRYQTMNTQLVIYKPGSGASTTRLESIWSGEVSVLATWERRVSNTTTSNLTVSNFLSLSFPGQWDASGGMTYSSTAQSGTLSVGASTMVSSSVNSLISGAVAYMSGSRMLPIPFATTLAAGEYYLGIMISSTSSSTGTNYSLGTMFSTQSLVGMLEFVDQAYKRFGKSVSDSSTAMLPFAGSIASTTTSPPSTLATSDIRNHVTPRRLVWNHQQSSY